MGQSNIYKNLNNFSQINFYSRKTIKKIILDKAKEIKYKNKEIIKNFIINKNISLTTDMWSCKFTNVSYINIILLYIDDNNSQIKKILLTCIDFTQKKSAENIFNKLLEVLKFYNINIYDTVLTTDCGANILKATNNLLRLVCFCHRLNTVVKTSLKSLKNINNNYNNLVINCKILLRFVKKTGNIQNQLKTKIQPGSNTRPWRGKIQLFTTILNNIENDNKLYNILVDLKKASLIENINIILLKEIVEFLKLFTSIFDHLETSSAPSLNYVIPSYYVIKKLCVPSNSDSDMIKSLKIQFKSELKQKFKASFAYFHWIAVWLIISLKTSSSFIILAKEN